MSKVNIISNETTNATHSPPGGRPWQAVRGAHKIRNLVVRKHQSGREETSSSKRGKFHKISVSYSLKLSRLYKMNTEKLFQITGDYVTLERILDQIKDCNGMIDEI